MNAPATAGQQAASVGAAAALAGLDEALDVAHAAGRPLGVVLVELHQLDRLRQVHGWPFVERLQEALAGRMQALARPGDRVLRPAEAHFLLVLNGLRSAAQVRLAAGKIERELARRMTLEGETVSPRLRQGVTVAEARASGASGRRLLQRVHAALARARRIGESVVFDDHTAPEHDVVGGWRLADELDEALQQGQFELWYQPKLALGDRKPAGAEALLRWNHPRHGLLGPDAFVPQAERDGRVQALTWSVLNMALRRLSDGPDGPAPKGVAVNVSPLCLHEPDFTVRVLEAVSLWGVSASRLTLELTETAAMRDADTGSVVLRELRAAGLRVSIDDFGSGYSSLGQFRDLPADELKIDRSFVSNLAREESSRAIVATVLELARRFGFTTVAEGIEDAATLEHLAAMGCDVGQGFHIARPMPGADWLAWERDHASPAAG